MKSFFSKKTGCFESASENNAYLANYFCINAPALAYPNSLAITPGSPEEEKLFGHYCNQ